MKINIKRDMILGLIGGIILLVFSIISFSSGVQSKGIMLMILAFVMLGFALYCFIKKFKENKNN